VRLTAVTTADTNSGAFTAAQRISDRAVNTARFLSLARAFCHLVVASFVSAAAAAAAADRAVCGSGPAFVHPVAWRLHLSTSNLVSRDTDSSPRADSKHLNRDARK